MKVEVMIPSPAVEFNFDSASTSPYVSAPSTPRGFGNYFFSAPTSPTHFSCHLPPFTKDNNNYTNIDHNNNNPDFKFDFDAQLNNASPLSADQLFHAGKIKPITQLNPKSGIPDSPNKDLVEAIRRTPRARGQSTLRVSDILLEEEKDEEGSSKEGSSSTLPSSWCKRWNLKDLLLFRSKSEGSKVPLKKSDEIEEELKNSSYRSRTIVNSVHIKKRKKGKGEVSAHELHYRVNRAVSEEMRRKTFLPYKRTVLLFGC